MKWLLLSVVAFSLLSEQALAYCSEPSPPSRSSRPEKPDPPSKPFCATSQTCSQFEVDTYNAKLRTYQSDVEDYNSDVEEYVRKLKAYINDAVDYAKCEVQELDE